jgi:hypothetical protein
VVSDLFRGPGGFLGVVINPGENKFIGWMPPTRDVLVVGAMFDQNGKNVTQTEMLARGYAKQQTDAQAAAGAGAQPTRRLFNRQWSEQQVSWKALLVRL